MENKTIIASGVLKVDLEKGTSKKGFDYYILRVYSNDNKETLIKVFVDRKECDYYEKRIK